MIHGNQHHFPDAWSRYIPADEPPEAKAAWDAAAQAIEAAEAATLQGRDRLMAEVYRQLAALRSSGAIPSVRSMHRPAKDSMLMLYGEKVTRADVTRRAQSG